MRNWDELAAPWLRAEARMEAAHGPVLEAMLARANLRPGQRVLDIGIGSGSSTMRAVDAVGQGGLVTGADVAPPFLERARIRLPDDVTLLEADAQTYAFAPGAFDGALSLFGTMFFEDTPAAFANIRRAMVPGGHFTFAAWAPPASNPWLSIAGQATNAILGPPEVRPDPNAPGPFRFALPDTALEALASAGWQAGVETIDVTLTPTGTPEEITATQMDLGVAASRIAAENADAADVEAIADTIASRFRQMQTKAGAVRVRGRVHIFHATA